MWTAPLAFSASCRKAQNSQTGRKARFFLCYSNPPKTSYGVSLPGVIGCAETHPKLEAEWGLCLLRLHRCDELAKKHFGIMRAGAGFRVPLEGENGAVGEGKALQ